MKIISHFHDYYDGVMNMGIDQQCPYIRQQTIIDLKYDRTAYLSWRAITDIKGQLSDISNFRTYLQPRQTNFIEHRGFFIIGFCGKIYPCIRRAKHNNITYEYNTDICDEDRKFFNRISFFDKDWSDFEKYFIEYKTPIFVIRPEQFEQEYNYKKVLIINDSLKQYNFVTIKDPYTAFQEIHQYISGVIGINAPTTVEISDKDMKIKKGFGHRYAFKKEPKKLK